MRAPNSQRSWHPRSTTLVLSSLFLLFLVFPESRARNVFLSETGVKTLVSADEKKDLQGEVKGDVPVDVKVPESKEAQEQVDSILSEKIKTEVSDLPEKVISEDKENEDLQVKEEPQTEKTDSGIRRFDLNLATEAPIEAAQKAKVNSKGIHIGSETHVEVSEVKVSSTTDRDDRIIESDEEQGEKFKRARVELESSLTETLNQEVPAQSEIQKSDLSEKKTVVINSDGLGKFETPEQKSEEVPKAPSKPEVTYTIIELLKQQAMLLQEKIRNKTLFETIKEPTLVIPEVPLLSEDEILASFKSLPSTKNHHDIDIEPFSHHSLSDKQQEIVQLSASIIAQQQRQTFISSLYDCARNLSVMNCMRIFVYPIIAETIPELIIQNIPGLPIEVNVSDLLPNRNKTKSARSATLLFYPLLNSEEIVMSLLKDALDTHRSYESVPSYIDPMNTTFSMLLPGHLRILQMAEKLLPVSNRPEYANRMYSCVQRFEYYSCLKYFAWPMMKKYYPTLPDFPEYLVVHPVYSQYPIVPFPLEPGQLPEVIEADLKRKPSAPLTLSILKEETKPIKGEMVQLNLSIANASTPEKGKEPLVNLKEMVKTIPEKAAPIRPPLIPIPQDQFNLLAKQFLSPQLQAEFATLSVKCIREVDYQGCMRYYTTPLLRQAQPTLPSITDFFALFQIPNFSQFFQIPDFSGLFQFPDFSGFAPPSFPGLPTIPTIPGVPTIPELPTIPTIPGVPTIPELPTIPTIPGVPTIPEAPTIPTIPGVPTIPEAPTIPTIPNIPNIPGVPTIPNLPMIPGTGSGTAEEGTAGQTAPAGESRNVEVGGNPIKSNSEEPIQPGISTTQNSPQSPQVPISSRKSEVASNVPVLSITGNEFVPILSEKPESVIFTILRLYQISDPSLVNTLAIPFLNSSTPEYSFLNLHQENTILLAKSMLPESTRSSFTEEMISCARDKDFLTCSKEIMFPTLAQYFPNLPSFPNFASLDSKNPAQVNSTLSTAPQISETNVKTDRHGEATLTITDTRFIPIFSEHPEGVVMDILRALQIATPNLPPGGLKTRDVIRSSGSENLLSEKQIMILEIGESLLPEEQRESFAKRMIECSKENAFLDCSRDIAFPSIAPYYPNLPAFPNFGNQAFGAKPQTDLNPVQFLRDGIQKPDIDANSAYFQQIEDHLQNEIENILVRTASVNDRSKSQNEPVVEGFSQIAPGRLTKQQRNIIRLSDSILSESVRPTYHARMTECLQSISFVACMQNVGWPLLRLNPLLLHSIPKPIPDYTSEASGPIPASAISLEGLKPPEQVSPELIVSRNPMGLIHLITPTVQEGPAQDITSSVGRQKSTTEIPPYAGQPFAPFLDLTKERVDPENPQGDTSPESEIKHDHSRKKRSPDLLDSYPENDPDEKRGSVRKNLSKTTFPNMTESELLQFLMHLKKTKDGELKGLKQPPKTYFIDNLDPELKNTLTPDQVQILKLVEDLNPESSRGIMSQLWQCIRGLSLIRCAGVFIWPMITSNIPLLSTFSGRSEVNSGVQDFFGMPPNDFEKELLQKKQEFEDVLLTWYKSLVEQKFETNIGFLRVKGHGNGELGISLAGFREGRAKIVKDNKNLPSILTIISDIMEDVLDPKTKPKPDKNKKDPKKGKSIKFEDNYQFLRNPEEDSKIERSMKDDRILAALLEKMRTNDSETKNDQREYFSIEDAYNAFELLFGTRLSSEIGNRLKTFSEDHFRSFVMRRTEEESQIDEIVPLEAQEKMVEEKLKVVPLLRPQTYYNLDDLAKTNDVKKESKNGFKDGSFRKNKHRTELSIQLPRLNDLVLSRKITSSIVNMGRGLRDKMMQMMPGIGLLISFLLQMALAHARTAASVAGVMSNMALGMGMFSMIRDAVFGQPNHPKVKYVYDTEANDPGVSWPKEISYWK